MVKVKLEDKESFIFSFKSSEPLFIGFMHFGSICVFNFSVFYFSPSNCYTRLMTIPFLVSSAMTTLFLRLLVLS